MKINLWTKLVISICIVSFRIIFYLSLSYYLKSEINDIVYSSWEHTTTAFKLDLAAWFPMRKIIDNNICIGFFNWKTYSCYQNIRMHDLSMLNKYISTDV